jgi:hypothetical protein
MLFISNAFIIVLSYDPNHSMQMTWDELAGKPYHSPIQVKRPMTFRTTGIQVIITVRFKENNPEHFT